MPITDLVGQGSILISSFTVGSVGENGLARTGRFRQTDGVVDHRIEDQVSEELPHLEFDLVTERFGLDKSQ